MRSKWWRQQLLNCIRILMLDIWLTWFGSSTITGGIFHPKSMMVTQDWRIRRSDKSHDLDQTSKSNSARRWRELTTRVHVLLLFHSTRHASATGEKVRVLRQSFLLPWWQFWAGHMNFLGINVKKKEKFLFWFLLNSLRWFRENN